MVLPVNFTNSDPMVNVHPAAHNEANTVVNSLESRIAVLEGAGITQQNFSVYTAASGTYAEISYGTSPTREVEWTRLGNWVNARYMLRLGAGYNWGSGWIAISLPATADMTLGNGVAPIIGHVTVGISGTFGTHIIGNVHVGRQPVDNDPDFCYVVPQMTGTFADGNLVLGVGNIPGQGSTSISNMHLHLSYRAQ